jgi:cob(I)alamin adenosyltransferase
VSDTLTARLEQEVAAMNGALAPLTSFVLPAGSPGAAHAHVARGVVRRAERRVVALADVEPMNSAVVRYLNRLSDHLFVLARKLNAAAGGDVLWTPGINR